MTTFPLSTIACTIGPTGISSPSYADIYSSLQASFQGIYGSDAYIDPDSPDGQMLAIFAQAQYDSNQATIAAYLAYSPASAQGAGLSSVVKINGLQRESATNSTANVTVVGVAGTTITDGVVGDTTGNQWALPSTVIIPNTGSVIVTAVCQTPGNVSAAANTINTILTPTSGWQTVTNSAQATPGAPVEADATLRQRQSVSTSLPSQTVLEGIFGAVANLPGVERLAAYENDTSGADANGVPGHSISLVVEGGDATTIATTIASKKAPGTGTYGTTSEIVLDKNGVPNTISFFVLANVTIHVMLTLKALTGYTSSTGATLVNAVVAFLNGLAIGQDSELSALLSPARLSGSAAVTSSGLTQAQLDVLSATYNALIPTLFQARGDMVITGGPYLAGAAAFSVQNVASYQVNDMISVTLDNDTTLTSSIADISGSVIRINGTVPVGRQINNGTLVYVADDLVIAFNEAAVSAVADVTLTVSA